MAVTFRKEVLEARSVSWLGSIELASPPARWFTVAIVAALTIATVALITFGHYTKRQSVTGTLVPTTGLASVSATSSGTLGKTWVRQGDTVRAGQRLAEIAGDSSTVAYGATMVSIAADLARKKAALDGTLGLRKAVADDQMRVFASAITLMEAQLTQLDSQASIEAQRVEKQSEQVERFKPSVRSGLIPRTQFVAQEDQLLAFQSELHRLNGMRIDLRHQIEEKRQAAREVPLDLQRFSRETEAQLADLSQQITQNEAKRLSVITAPTDGRITAVLVKTGQGVVSGQTLLSILPSGATLEAQLLVPSRAIASVKAGSAVALRYSAFPYQQYGVQLGKVESVSRSALAPKEVEQLTGKPSDDPMYRVYVNLEGQRLAQQQLSPGMTLTGDILMERRTLLDWAMEPLQGLRLAMAGRTGDRIP